MRAVRAVDDLEPKRLLHGTEGPLLVWPDSVEEHGGVMGTMFDWPGVYLPDLSDPATRGWLLELVREAWGDPRLTTRCRAPLRVSGDADSGFADGPWDIVSASENVTISILGACGATEAEALVAALEAAP
jgi:hypothetical protein